MSKLLSEFYGMNIYTQKATYVGKVEDVILNLEKGEVMRLSLKPLRGGMAQGGDVKKILQQESVPYTDVLDVGDIVVVSKAPTPLRK